MKIRKILPLVLLVVASVFLFTGCDALLDAIFSNNTITVYVWAYIPTYGYFPSYDTVTVVVDGASAGTAEYDGNDGLWMYWSLSVPKLSAGVHSAYVQYYHPVGLNASGVPYTSSTQFVDFGGTTENAVDLGFSF